MVVEVSDGHRLRDDGCPVVRFVQARQVCFTSFGATQCDQVLPTVLFLQHEEVSIERRLRNL